MLEQVLDSLREHRSFVVTSHSRPDGDAVGSVLAATQMLRAMGKKADAVLSDGVPLIYRALPFADDIDHAAKLGGVYDAALILECDSLARTGIQGLDAAARVLINIDHHESAREFAHINWIDSAASATAELVFQLAKAAGVAITPAIATCLYTAVLTDTGAFCFAGTNEHTFGLARELVQAGADPAAIARSVYFANPESKFRLLGAALSNLRRTGNVVLMHVTQAQMKEFSASEEDCEGLVNYGVGIRNVEVAIFFRELPDGRFRVSLRSKGGINVAEIAALFGGGGHTCAGGCSLDGPLAAASRLIICEVQQRLNKAG